MNEFYEQVYAVVERIPVGKVASYGQIARMLGRPRAGREVGRAMRCCPEGLPWQRVVMSDGSIAGGMSAEMRRTVLEAELVAFLPDGRVDMASCRWQGKGEARMALSKLPNIGKVTERQLIESGIETPDQLKKIGAKEALLLIRAKSDPGACIRVLYALQGAVEGVKDTALDEETKADLLAFFRTL